MQAFVRPLGVVFVAVCVGLVPAWGQDTKSAPGQTRHIVHVVKLGSATDIAAVLARQFRGDAEVDILPEPNGNCLLIHANARVFDDVIKTLQVLDRRPRLVAVEVWIADVPAPEKGEEAKTEIDEKSLTGPSGEVLVKLRELQRKGTLSSLRRLQTAVAENQSASVLEGEHKPVVSGTVTTGTGRVSRTIRYHQVGSQVRCTPRVADDKAVLLELKVEDVRLYQPADGIPIGKDEKNESILATEVVTSNYNGTVAVGQGQAVLLRGVKTEAKGASKPRTLILATARVIDETKPEEAKPQDEEPRRPIRRPQPPRDPFELPER